MGDDTFPEGINARESMGHGGGSESSCTPDVVLMTSSLAISDQFSVLTTWKNWFEFCSSHPKRMDNSKKKNLIETAITSLG